MAKLTLKAGGLRYYFDFLALAMSAYAEELAELDRAIALMRAVKDANDPDWRLAGVLFSQT